MSREAALAARARSLLSRPGAWLDAAPDGYAVRLLADRRRRPLLRLPEAVFEELAREPGLASCELGGWRLAAGAGERAPSPPPGRPGVIEGERTVIEPDGRSARRTVNLGESPIAWLARRKDAAGKPWLSRAEAAAGERLREEFHTAGMVGRLTMCWDAAPRGSGGRGPAAAPAERAVAARRRVAEALEAVGPGLREILERVCLDGAALEAAERGLGLPRRAGKAVLKLALQRLAAHYRIG